MFRGFFLAGRVPKTTVPEARGDAFAEALFTDKIFPEHKLAQPAYGETTRRHRQTRIAQAALAGALTLGLIGLLHIRTVKSNYFPAVTSLLSQIDQLVSAAALRTENLRFGTARRERVRDDALALINAMAAIHINRVDTIAAPTSLLTSANARITQAISAGYSVAVLHAAYNALTEKSNLVAILEPTPPPGALLPTSLQALGATVDNILQYVQIHPRLSGDREATKYWRSRRADRLCAGCAVALGLYDRLPALRARAQQHKDAAHQSTKLQPIVEQILQDRYNAAINDAYSNNPLVISVKKLSKLASNLNTQVASSTGSGRQLLADIQTTLDAIAALLVTPDY